MNRRIYNHYMDIYYSEQTTEFKVHRLYIVTAVNEESEYTTLVHINNFISDSGRILIFENTHCFIIMENGSIHRYTHENGTETINYNINYTIECYKEYAYK